MPKRRKGRDCREEHGGTPPLAAIVPAYNEAGRIGQVLAVLRQIDEIGEILVVDDGSTDGTGEEALQAAQGDPRLRLLRHSLNQGKGQALYTGWRATKAPLLLLIDADLINLQPSHVRGLIQPVLCGEAEMTLGLFQRGYWRTDIAHWLTPWLSGQRCVRAELFEHISQQAAEGYGFETALSLAARKEGWRCQKVPLPGASHPPGDQPRGGWHGPATKVKMFADIFRAWYRVGYWREYLPWMARRVRLALVLFFAFGIGLVNNCSGMTAGQQNRLLQRFIGDNETMWLLWGKLKATIDLLH